MNELINIYRNKGWIKARILKFKFIFILKFYLES